MSKHPGQPQPKDDIIKAFYPKVYRYAAYLVGNVEDASDITQHAFMKFFTVGESGCPLFRGPGALFADTKNSARRLWRNRQRRREVPLPDGLPLSAGNHKPEDELQWKELRTRILKAVNTLKPIHREVFVARYERGVSTEEIATVLGITEKNVRTRLHRARQAILAAIPDLAELL